MNPYSSDDPRTPYQQSPNNGDIYHDTTVRENYNSGGAYGQQQRQSYVDPSGNRVERREEFIEDQNQARINTRYWITAVTYFLLGVLEVILGLRLLFRLLGANEGNAFISFLYDLSHVFVGAFNGIFNDQTIGTRSVFEVSTIIAMLIYALIAWGIVSLARVFFTPTLPEHQSVSTTRRRRI